MSHDSWSKQLRIAGNDPAAVAAALRGSLPTDGLQQAGTAVLRTIRSDDLGTIGSELVDALGKRGWTGDHELGTELEHYTLLTPSALRPLRIELDWLADTALNQPVGTESFIDLVDGTLWPAMLFDDDQGPDDFDPESERWLLVAGLGSAAAYEVMQRFVSTVEHPELASRLSEAIVGSGAFRRFQDTLSRHASEYTRWHRVRYDAQLGQGRAWLADHGYRPIS